MTQDAASQTDDTPWYKQFWPWFLIALPGSVVVAGIFTVFFAFEHADVVVKDNYYKEGLAINTEVADIQQAQKLNIKGQLTLEQGILTLSLDDLPSQATYNLELSLHHPLDDTQDRKILLMNSGNGIFKGQLGEIQQGRWYIDLYTVQQTPAWRIKMEVMYPQASLPISAN